MRCATANETEENTVIDLAMPREFHRMFTRPLSRCIDDVSRRLVPAIPIPPSSVCLRSVSPMVCPNHLRANEPGGACQDLRDSEPGVSSDL
jgi:hypothetical protein